MASQTPIGSSKIPVALPYGTLQVGNAAGTLYTNNGMTIAEWTAPKGGWVIGFSANLTGTLTTGTLSFTPTLNGVPMINTFVNGTINIGTLSTYERDQAQQGGFQFKEGQTLGLTFQKTGTIAPTTRDLNGLLMVLLNDYDY